MDSLQQYQQSVEITESFFKLEMARPILFTVVSVRVTVLRKSRALQLVYYTTELSAGWQLSLHQHENKSETQTNKQHRLSHLKGCTSVFRDIEGDISSCFNIDFTYILRIPPPAC